MKTAVLRYGLLLPKKRRKPWRLVPHAWRALAWWLRAPRLVRELAPGEPPIPEHEWRVERADTFVRTLYL